MGWDGDGESGWVSGELLLNGEMKGNMFFFGLEKRSFGFGKTGARKRQGTTYFGYLGLLYLKLGPK